MCAASPTGGRVPSNMLSPTGWGGPAGLSPGGGMARPKVPIQAVSLAAFLFAGLLPGYPCTVSAQVRDTAKVDSAVARARQRVLARPNPIKLHEVVFAGGVRGLAFLGAQPLQRYIQDHRNGTTNDI